MPTLNQVFQNAFKNQHVEKKMKINLRKEELSSLISNRLRGSTSRSKIESEVANETGPPGVCTSGT